ncbi:MAG: hypothetical protein RMJ67_05985 [Elusimicrobiota bacterium]|nr:hypothetical protein [Endomicrobiia bacterium]MDW8166042.1 hypothetical protein [Elusimicrobiota bacterium]
MENEKRKLINLYLTEKEISILISALKYESLFSSYRAYALSILNQLLKQIESNNEEINNSGEQD